MAMHEMLRGLSSARARAEKRLKKELHAKLKKAKTASIGERKRLQSEIEQLKGKIKGLRQSRLWRISGRKRKGRKRKQRKPRREEKQQVNQQGLQQ
jgi:hypothetical protein